MEYVVTGCTDCPMAQYTDRRGDFCIHPSAEEGNVLEDDEHFNPVTPVWCPLNKEPITITKK